MYDWYEVVCATRKMKREYIRIYFLFLTVISSAVICRSQEDSTREISWADSTNHPVFDIHVGAGWLSGARLGLRVHFFRNISFETSFGIPVSHFIVGGEREKRYGIGVNWHQDESSGLIVSLLFANIVQPNRSFPENVPNNKFFGYLRFSLNIGYYYWDKSNFVFFSRLGGIYDLVRDSNDHYRGHFSGTNIDIGIGLCLQSKK